MNNVQTQPETDERIPEDLRGHEDAACELAGVKPDDFEARRALWQAVDAWDRMTRAIYRKDKASYKEAREGWEKVKRHKDIITITEFDPQGDEIFGPELAETLYKFYANALVAYTKASIERLQICRQIRDHVLKNNTDNSENPISFNCRVYDMLKYWEPGTKDKVPKQIKAWKEEEQRAVPNLQPWKSLANTDPETTLKKGQRFYRFVKEMSHAHEGFFPGKTFDTSEDGKVGKWQPGSICPEKAKPTSLNAKYYTYRVIWSEKDREFVGLCAEFPSLSWLEPDQEAALRGIVSLVKDSVADMAQSGETIPAPLALQKYSGRFQVRTTPEMHRQLAMQAAEQGVSLNSLINSHLAGYHGG